MEMRVAAICVACYIAAMFRFSTKTLLFAFALVALWCSTFGGYAAGRDVRATVMLILFLAAGYAAVYSRGKSRAFWAGVFIVMLLMGGSFFAAPVGKYVPSFFWRNDRPFQTNAPYSAPTTYYPAPTAYQPPAQPVPATPGQPIAPMAAPVTVFPVTVSNYHFTLAVTDTIAAVWTLVLGALVGWIGMWIYGTRDQDQSAG